MKKQIYALMMGMILMMGTAPPGISETVSGQTKSIGTEAGEKARDMRVQVGEISQKIFESAQVLSRRVQEEWRKFSEAYNQPAKP